MLREPEGAGRLAWEASQIIPSQVHGGVPRAPDLSSSVPSKLRVEWEKVRARVDHILNASPDETFQILIDGGHHLDADQPEQRGNLEKAPGGVSRRTFADPERIRCRQCGLSGLLTGKPTEDRSVISNFRVCSAVDVVYWAAARFWKERQTARRKACGLSEEIQAIRAEIERLRSYFPRRIHDHALQTLRKDREELRCVEQDNDVYEGMFLVFKCPRPRGDRQASQKI